MMRTSSFSLMPSKLLDATNSFVSKESHVLHITNIPQKTTHICHLTLLSLLNN